MNKFSFRFPMKNKPLLNKWKQAVRRIQPGSKHKAWTPTGNHLLCSDHFLPSDHSLTELQMNRAFDVLNSRSKFGRGHAAAITAHNLHDVMDIYTDFSSYLRSLKNIDGVPIVQSRRKTFAVGMISAFHAIIQLSGELLGNSDYILTFRFSQDHLETLFSKIRRMGGFHNNPPACHFKAALKRLLCVQSIRASKSANVA